MNQLEKLKDQAKISYLTSEINDKDEGKIEFIIQAALLLKDHYCPERTKYFREAIILAEKLKRWKTAFNLAAYALLKKDGTEYFRSILIKYKGKEDFKEEDHDKST